MPVDAFRLCPHLKALLSECVKYMYLVFRPRRRSTPTFQSAHGLWWRLQATGVEKARRRIEDTSFHFSDSTG